MSTDKHVDLEALVMGDDRADLSQATDPLAQRAARGGAADPRDLVADLNAEREYAAARAESQQRSAGQGGAPTGPAGAQEPASGQDSVDAQGRPTHSSTGVPLDYSQQVPVRPATSVIMLREGRGGDPLEVFVQHRVKTMDFAAGVVVFPGGRVDPEDSESALTLPLDPAAEAAHTRAWERTDAAEAGGARTLLACAVREVEEETGQRIAPAALSPWANLVTPPGRSKRFDTYFYVTGGAELSALTHRTTEATNSEWLSVRGLLEGERAERYRLMRPTLALLTELEALGGLASVMDLATGGERTIESIRPRIPGVH
ncbi:NUDIX hydrolase [Brevibacterium album]|uniref:NUDIX hydrolase n=1 Tax=Brevibacterium album TaxID=417948 RepID=UPI0004154E62|nr:NUDIX hydrolase [Brevibacterium album]